MDYLLTVSSDGVQQEPVAVNEGHLESFLEQSAVSALASTASFWVMEKFEDPIWREQIKKALCCSRLFGCIGLSCNECGNAITQGKYAREFAPWIS